MPKKSRKARKKVNQKKPNIKVLDYIPDDPLIPEDKYHLMPIHPSSMAWQIIQSQLRDIKNIGHKDVIATIRKSGKKREFRFLFNEYDECQHITAYEKIND